MNDDEINFWLDKFKEISQEVELAITNARCDSNITKITKIGADGTPTHKIDEYAEEAALNIIKNCGKSTVVISEEIGTIQLGKNPEVVLIMDPLDGTSNALKNIPCYGISLAIAPLNIKQLNEITIGDIEIGYVKNIPTQDEYVAIKSKGATKNNKPMTISNITHANEATLSTYIYRAKRGSLDKLCSSIRRMRLIGAIAIELCYVADGTYDVFLDIGQVRVLDIAAAQLIVKENGGLVTNIKSEKLVTQLDLMGKTSIIATANKPLQEDVLRLL